MVRAITFITSLALALITRVGVGVTLGVCGCGHVGTGVITMGATKGRVALRVITMVSMGMRMRG